MSVNPSKIGAMCGLQGHHPIAMEIQCILYFSNFCGSLHCLLLVYLLFLPNINTAKILKNTTIFLKCQQWWRSLFQRKKYYLLFLKRKWFHQLKVYTSSALSSQIMNSDFSLLSSLFVEKHVSVLCLHGAFSAVCDWVFFACLCHFLKICELGWKMCVLSLRYIWKKFRKKEYLWSLWKGSSFHHPRLWLSFTKMFLM